MILWTLSTRSDDKPAEGLAGTLAAGLSKCSKPAAYKTGSGLVLGHYVYDYIIVGAGSAGCVLANRLSADPGCRVLLLEAGPVDWHPFIHMPAGIAKMVNRKGVNWDYYTEPEAALDQRKLWWPRGKVLGGSSSINAMCYIRGNPADYDEWVSLGATGWSWADVLPWFKRSETNSRGAGEFHGGAGPLHVSDLRHHNPLSEVFIESARSVGHSANPDFNGPVQSGVGFYQVTQRDGARCSTAASYLREARGRQNLTVLTRAMAQRLLFSKGRVVGIEYRRRGRLETVFAEREVVLSGGALNSPHLLMLSGIGDPHHLREAGVALRHALPGVGANLQDHLDACTLYHCTRKVTYDRTNDVAIALRYLLFRDGIGSSNVAEAGGFARSRLAEDSRPDIQFHFVPAMLDDHGRNRLPGRGFTLHACALRPRSRGYLRLRSADPAVPPAIHANYLSDPESHDLRSMREAVRMSREILNASAFAAYRGDEIHPGATATDDAAIDAFIRRKAETIYHPTGTCRMGRDGTSVVDPKFRVHGLDGLRVVDASVMPKLIGGNTNAPTIMMAERAAHWMIGP